MTFGLQVSDDGLDGGAPAQLVLDDTEDAALLARDKDPTWILSFMATVSLIDIGSLDRTAGKCLGTLDDVENFGIVNIDRNTSRTMCWRSVCIWS